MLRLASLFLTFTAAIGLVWALTRSRANDPARLGPAPPADQVDRAHRWLQIAVLLTVAAILTTIAWFQPALANERLLSLIVPFLGMVGTVAGLVKCLKAGEVAMRDDLTFARRDEPREYWALILFIASFAGLTTWQVLAS